MLMEEDAPHVRAGVQVARLALPMPPPPRGLNWRSWPQVKGFPVAPSGTIDYQPERGAEWVRPDARA